jgi:cytochrome c-type biogenesis protein CcmE
VNPTRRRRLLLVFALLAAAAIAAFLVAKALQENLTYLHTPSEVRTGAPPAARFRLGGVVCEGSVHRREGTLQVDFAVTDRKRQVPVRYVGILPDMFREGTSIIATGKLRDGTFEADQVLAKHDETYMPREVREAMAASAGKPHPTTCGVP